MGEGPSRVRIARRVVGRTTLGVSLPKPLFLSATTTHSPMFFPFRHPRENKPYFPDLQARSFCYPKNRRWTKGTFPLAHLSFFDNLLLTLDRCGPSPAPSVLFQLSRLFA